MHDAKGSGRARVARGGHTGASLVVAWLALASCAPSRPADEPAEQKPSGATSGSATPVPDAAQTLAAATASTPLDARVRRALVRVSELRHLPIKANVVGVRLARSEMAQRVRAQIVEEVPAAAARAEADVAIGFGLCPRGFNYIDSLVELLGNELAGYYDPKQKLMVLADELDGEEFTVTLAHELVHALQDQHYDLAKAFDYEQDASDRQGALHALAEGDATSAMLDELLASRNQTALDLSDAAIGFQLRAGMAMSQDSAGVPDFVKRAAISPYVDGLDFVHGLRRSGGWAAVDAAWRDPPTTSEQLLHLTKYAQHEPAVSVPIPSPPGSDWQLTHHDVFGEQSVALILEEWLGRPRARSAAEGWGGDRIAVFEQAALTAVAWHLHWDDPASARRAWEAFLSYGGATPPAPSRQLWEGCLPRPGLGPLAAVGSGRELVIVVGPFPRDPQITAPSPDCGKALQWAKRVLQTAATSR